MLRSMMYLFISILGISAWAISTQRPNSWSEGQPAQGTSQVLANIDPLSVELPQAIGKLIDSKTAIFYFSPTCPHCQAVVPEINALREHSELSWLGIASSSSSEDMMRAFKEAYDIHFPIVRDEGGLFSSALGARATPNVYLLSPQDPSEDRYWLWEAYTPFERGKGAILMLRYALGQGEDPFHYFKGYQGSEVCGSCHVQEYLSWSTTHHAQAYHTLYKRDRANDPKCVSCHVVGLEDIGGFKMGDHKSPLRDVGCESCHSQSGPHDGAYQPALNSCESCHNPEHSINFSVEKGLPHIDHYVSNTMSEEDLKSRIKEISEGRAERPLLAFNSEETVGAQSCSSCHEGVHPDDPHLKAYKTLSRKDRKIGSCVSCHATPKEMGPRSSAPEDYRHSEGVGCESCHGSGKQHVQDPKLTNIVRLGESCPECVLETLCTSCHTEEWDSDWDLHQRLTFYRSHRENSKEQIKDHD